MASVYEDWSDDRGGVEDVSIVRWWPDFLISRANRHTLRGRTFFEIVGVSSREVPLPEEEREIYLSLHVGYVALNLTDDRGRRYFSTEISLNEFLADDRTSQVWHCPSFSAFVDDRSLERTEFR